MKSSHLQVCLEYRLCAKHLDTVGVFVLLVVLLGFGLVCLGAKHEFGDDLPVAWQVVLLLKLILGQVSVVLQVGTVTGVGERNPRVGLHDGRSVLRPDGEVFGVLWDVLLLSLDDGLRFEE